jgi:FAD/FMN-containing dehydrogenase
MTSQKFSPRAASAVADSLRSCMRGSILVVEDPGYEAGRRLWNGAVSGRPAIIARCADETDAAAVVRAAREHGMPLSVRGGGHDWAGRALCHEGMVLDLSGMRHVSVNPAARMAVAGGGATAGDVAAAAAPFGLAPVTGIVNAVGMAGLALAGGYGPLNGKHGLVLDSLAGARVVLGDGRVVTASETDDADLYWAIRGGGGTFGAVAQARYRLYPLDSVLTGLIVFPIAQAETVLGGYREVIMDAPDELTIQLGFFSAPDSQAMIFLFPLWSGDLREGEQTVSRLRGLGMPISAHVASMAYADALAMFDSHVVNGNHYAVRTRSLPGLTAETGAILVDAARNAASPFSGLGIHHFHGAAARVPAEDTAFALRRDHLMVEIIASWEPADAAASVHERWADDLSSRLEPYALPGGYPNLLGPGERDRLVFAYGPNATRLRELKQRFDPEGIFSSATGTLDAPVG